MDSTKVTVTVRVESPLGDEDETTLDIEVTARVRAHTPGGAARLTVAKVMEALGAYR